MYIAAIRIKENIILTAGCTGVGSLGKRDHRGGGVLCTLPGGMKGPGHPCDQWWRFQMKSRKTRI